MIQKVLVAFTLLSLTSMSIVSCSEGSSDRQSKKSSNSEDKKTSESEDKRTSKSEESKVPESDGSYSLDDILDDEWIMTCQKAGKIFMERSQIFKEESSGKYTVTFSGAFYEDEECEDVLVEFEFNDLEVELDIDDNTIESCPTEEGIEDYKEQYKKQMRKEPEEENLCGKYSFIDIDQIELENDDGEPFVFERK